MTKTELTELISAYRELITAYKEIADEQERRGRIRQLSVTPYDDYLDSLQKIASINESIYEIELSISTMESNLGE